MTEKDARAKGYQFTGHYSSQEPEVIKAKAVEIRSEGFNACVVSTSFKTRWGGGTGYSVYAEKKFFIQKGIIEAEKHLAILDERRATAYEVYQRTLKELNGAEQEMKDINKKIFKNVNIKNATLSHDGSKVYFHTKNKLYSLKMK